MFKHASKLVACATLALCTTAFAHYYDLGYIDDDGLKYFTAYVGPTQSYKTIQAAANDLSKLGTKAYASIMIDPGSYTEAVSITIPTNVDALNLSPNDYETYPTVKIYGKAAPAITFKGGKSSLWVAVDRLLLYAPDNTSQNVSLKNTATMYRLTLNTVYAYAKTYGTAHYGVYDNSNKVEELLVNPGCDFWGGATGIWTNAKSPLIRGANTSGSFTYLCGSAYAAYFSRQRGGSVSIDGAQITSLTKFQKTVSIGKAESFTYARNAAWVGGKANAVDVVNSSNDKLSLTVKENVFNNCSQKALTMAGRNITTYIYANTGSTCPLP